MSLAAATSALLSSNILKRETTSSATACFICHHSFSLITRQHKCKHCLKAVCSDCSPNKLAVPSFDETNKPHRVCSSCYYTLPNIKKAPPITKSADYSYNSILTDPTKHSVSVWLKTFNKCWLRSKYGHIYQQKQTALLEKAEPKTERPVFGRRKALPIETGVDYRKNVISNVNAEDDNPVIVIEAGELWLNIMDAVGIPAREISALDKPSCYCKFYVTNNDKYFADNNKYRTKTCKNTLNPTWNEDKTIKITNTTATLVIELWDNEKYLGRLAIKLNSLFLHYNYLSHSKAKANENRLIDDWFEVNIRDKWKRAIKKHHINNYNESSISECDVPIYSKLKSIPNIRSDDGKQEHKCYIRLQIKLETTWWAHFISHFDPVLDKRPHKVKFHLPLTIGEINKVLMDWGTVIGAWNEEQKQILTWIKYKWSIIYLVLFTCFVYYPWFTMFYMELRCLIYLCNVYVNIEASKKKDINLPLVLHCLCLFFGYIQVLIQKIMLQQIEINNKSFDEASFIMSPRLREESELEFYFEMEGNKESVNGNEKKEKEEEASEQSEISMSAFGSFAANKAIKISGLKAKLWWFQESLVFMNDSLDRLQGIICWDVGYAHITSLLCVVLFILCIISILLRGTDSVRHQIYVIGIISLSYYSKPMQFILWMIFGSTYWYFNCYRRYNQFRNNDQLFSTHNVFVEKKQNELEAEEKSYFMKLWIKINAFIVWIVMKAFERKKSDTKKVSDNWEKVELRQEKSGRDKKGERRRHIILTQFDGTFDKKYQFLLSRLKCAKIVTF